MAQEKGKGCCLAILVGFGAMMLAGYCASREDEKRKAAEQQQAAAEAERRQQVDAAAKALLDGGARQLLDKTDASKLPLEKREDLRRVRAVWGVTSAEPASLAHWSNTAALLWVLDAKAEAILVVESMMRRFPQAILDPGVTLNAYLVTTLPQYKRLSAASHLIAAQQKYNSQFRAETVPVPVVSSVADDRKLPPRLRAKALCLIGVQLARTGIKDGDDKTMRKSLDAFARAQRLDPAGAVGKLAAENTRILRDQYPALRRVSSQ